MFQTLDENINYHMICKNTDIFKAIENKFYENFCEYKELDVIFLINGKNINKNKSSDENGIHKNDCINIIF